MASGKKGERLDKYLSEALELSRSQSRALIAKKKVLVDGLVAQKADWLLSEAFCRWEDREKYHPYEKHHAAVRDACELAERLGVKRLILWHSEEDTLENRTALYTLEGRRYYGGRLIVPRDGDVIDLNGGEE